RRSLPKRGNWICPSSTWIAPVSRKLPMPFFLLLNLGYPLLPFHLPTFLSLHLRKKFLKAFSRSRNASSGAHLEPSYSQGRSVCFKTLSSFCKLCALGILRPAWYSAWERDSPQL